ncbi:MAG: methylated-DNA--[protein]-cysteine S-methyltransferase [Deinococcales bacterium]|nr:methylated-DNA--[protein]-cysteine S-methyltransferase [Chitinophagaceae bacterium]
MKINFGKTISYSERAKHLSQLKCIRAAAIYNGKNKIAIIVPCHSVVYTDKTLIMVAAFGVKNAFCNIN